MLLRFVVSGAGQAVRSLDQGLCLALSRFVTADENDIKVRLADDPWASAGLLRVGTIEPWALWLDSRPENSAD
jgi:hypothetical protein